MPTYEYKCKSCENNFEEFQNVNDKPLSKCPECEGELTRVFHPVGVIFKGSGFYTTDYKNKHKPREKTSKAAKTSKKKDKKEKSSSCSSAKECPAAGNCS